MAEDAARLARVAASRARARGKTAAQKRLNKICETMSAPRRALAVTVAAEARGWIGKNIPGANERVALWFRIVNAIETAADDETAERVGRLFRHVFRTAPLQAFAVWTQPLRELSQGVCRQMHGLIALGQRSHEWVRKVENWRFDASSPRPALAQLARHLLVKWEMPAFMDTVWLNDGWVWKEFQDWYQHIGLGGSPRDDKAPVQMSKQQVEFFAEIPAAWSLPEHIWRVRAYLEARGLGAGQEHAVLIACSRLGDSRLSVQNTERRPFWLSVMCFAIRHPEFPQRQIDPLVSYLEAQKFGARAPMPGLTMKGRSPNMLLREMVVWQESVSRGLDLSGVFRPSGRGGLQLDGPDGAWDISELLSSREVLEEGIAMRHCVANYIPYCATGRTSMWSLKRMDRTGKAQRKLTVEVDTSGVIAQARGLANRWPTAEEMTVLETWARAEALTIAKTIGGPIPRRR
jgi:hypothetical protein